jgi:hypothetical protein
MRCRGDHAGSDAQLDRFDKRLRAIRDAETNRPRRQAKSKHPRAPQRFASWQPVRADTAPDGRLRTHDAVQG